MKKKKTAKLYVITGPSGVGKGTILADFFKQNPREIVYSVSTTTRKPRPTEKETVNYFFTNIDDFKESIKNNEFLEWAEYSGNFYGTKKEFVMNNLEKGIDVILEIETIGAKKIMEEFSDCVSIFFFPPTLSELENRLRGRQTEDDASINKRLSVAKDELDLIDKYQYHIENDEIEKAVQRLQEIYDKEKGV